MRDLPTTDRSEFSKLTALDRRRFIAGLLAVPVAASIPALASVVAAESASLMPWDLVQWELVGRWVATIDGGGVKINDIKIRKLVAESET